MIGVRTELVRDLLFPFVEAGLFGDLEVHAAERIGSSCVDDLGFFDVLSVACAIWATQQGHVCFDLDDEAVWASVSEQHRPDVATWIEAVSSSHLVHVARSWKDSVDGTRPLVLCERRLYLARQWIDEGVVVERLKSRRSIPVRSVDSAAVDALFASEDRDGRQYEAVLQSLTARTSILAGGPGTGKTYTIARILVAAVRSGVHSIALAAPTAKAAVQMRNSLTQALAGDIPDLDLEQRRLLEQLEPSTIHRLLGSRAGTSTRFEHGPGYPLPHQLVVVDEMSMVSLPLMARLLEAVSDETNLVLVGDPGQLDSVENGSVLRDLTDIDLGPSIPMTILEFSRRNLGTRSSDFSAAVRSGDFDRAIAVLREDDADSSLRWIDTEDPLGSIAALSEVLASWRELADRAAHDDLDGSLRSLNEARILCPHREGPYGVEAWNRAVSQVVSDSRDRWRAGDIVIKTHNDLSQGLANGDTGVVVRDEGGLVFAFRHADSVVKVPVTVDEAVELAFATTVHKAQGSEFSTVAVVVPPRSSPLSTRELLYTAMTRAKPRAVIIGSTDDIAHAIATQRRRSSGSKDRLTSDWG